MRVGDAKTGKELRKYEGHGGCVGCAAFFPDDQRAAFGQLRRYTAALFIWPLFVRSG